MNRTPLRRSAAPAAAALALALGLSACSAANESSASESDNGGSELSGTLNGAGASSQQAAMGGWQAGFQTANPDVTVNYDPIGSGGGRETFISGGVTFAGSDAFMSDEELAAAEDGPCPDGIVEIPTYVSPIALAFNLEGVEELNLSPEAVGGIFAGKITKWNDPKIAADNPDVELPSGGITPVHRSDESGTTENFTAYLEEAAGGSWPHGTVETWPIDGGEAADGTSGVVSAVEQGNGTIGYADASQVGELGTASVGVGAEFVPYSPEAAAAVVDASEQVQGRAETDLAIKLDRGTEAEGVYPIVLVSYHIACSSYEDEQTADLVKAFLSYVVSEEGQQAAAEAAGSAPISSDLREQAQSTIDQISTAS